MNQNKINREDPSNYYKGELISGFINCELVTKTPLFIPDIENIVYDKSTKHNQYRFYKINGDYIIPGSSIRGTIRSIYEIITNSCMSTIDGKERVKNNEVFDPVVKPCNNRNKLCKTCMLFGMVGDTSYGSRVRFTDAKASSYINSSMDMVTLKELSSPKISYLPFYFKNDRDSKSLKISGRKLYWHQPKAADNSSVYSTNKKNNRNITAEQLLKVGEKFQFKVFFDRITKEQLSNLLWALTLGENSKNSKYCHKIGHGKPIGLGSCKITVESIYKRTYYNDEYKLESIDANEMISKAIICSKEDLLNVCDFTYLKNLNISYPPFKWFSKNKKSLPDINKTREYQLDAALSNNGSYNKNKRW